MRNLAWLGLPWLVLFSSAMSDRGVFENHSRDRHGSIFDGAEWDGLRWVVAGSGNVRSVRIVFGKNLSRGRHGCVFEDAERDALWSGNMRLADVRSVDVGRGAPWNRSLGWRACVVENAERDG